jgi:predicted DNA-binding transcriptional regulator AlpA
MCRRIGVSGPTFDKLVKRGVLPEPVRLSRKLVLFCVAEVEEALRRFQQGQKGSANVAS